MTSKLHIAIIDCAIKTPSTHCFNQLVHQFNHKFTYHPLPQLGQKCLQPADAYIVFGSYSNVCDRLSWQKDLAHFMLAELKKGKPQLGICFAHQLAADLFGAPVDRVDPASPDVSHHGIRKLEIMENKLNLTNDEEIYIFTSHSYEVKKLPKNFDLIATSNECKIDGMSHQDYPFFSFQGHPEATSFFVEDAINPSRSNKITLDEFSKAQKGGKVIIGQFIKFAENYSTSFK